MVDLVAVTPLAELVPLEIGAVRMSEVVVGTAQLVAPFKGQAAAVSAALRDAAGVDLPGPGAVTAGGDVRALWMGGGQALVLGADALALDGAAVTDLSDGYAVARVEGPDAEAALARLVPVDVRALGEGATARTLLGHMSASVTRVGAQAFEVMVMRSMAGTLLHDLERAARGLLAR